MSKVKAEKSTPPTTPADNAIVVASPTALATVDYGDDATDFGHGVAPGYENQSSADTTLPYLYLLQPMSPELETNQEARAGMWLNTGTKQLATSFFFVPSITKHEYTEWKPDRGGYAGRHEVDSPIIQAAIKNGSFGDYKTKDGNELVETFNVFGVAWNETMDPCYVMIAFTSTKIKVYKQWMTVQRSFHVTLPSPTDPTKTLKKVPPIWAHSCLISTTYVQDNPKGKFYLPKIEPARGSIAKSLLTPQDEVYQMAKMGRDLLAAGSVKVDYAQSQGGVVDTGKVPF